MIVRITLERIMKKMNIVTSKSSTNIRKRNNKKIDRRTAAGGQRLRQLSIHEKISML